MKTWPSKYYYQVCPYCRSKKIERVAMVRMGGSSSLILADGNRLYSTGYFCECCKRYHESEAFKYICDRKEMRRDMLSLKKFLAGGVK